MNIILGSQSPRRRELMAGLDIPFSCVTIDADESFPADLKAGDIPMYISRSKARAYASELKDKVYEQTAFLPPFSVFHLVRAHQEGDHLKTRKRDLTRLACWHRAPGLPTAS